MKTPRPTLAVLLAIGILSVAPVAASRPAPPGPIPVTSVEPDPIVELGVSATQSGGFAVFVGTKSERAFATVVTTGVAKPLALLAGTTRTLVTAPATQGGDAYVALVGEAEVRTMLFDATTLGASNGNTTAVAPGTRASLGGSGSAPLLALSTLAQTTIGPLGGRGTSVFTPEAKAPAVIGASTKGGLLAYAKGNGASLQALGQTGAPTSDAPFVFADSLPTRDVSVIALGDDQLVALWPEGASRGPRVGRIGSDGVVVEPRNLPIGTLAIVADPSAPKAADAKVVRTDGTQLFEATWSGTLPDGSLEPTARIIGIGGSDTAVKGACNAEACLYAIFDSRGARYSYVPRTGAIIESAIEQPTISTTSYVVPPGSSISAGSAPADSPSGCSVGKTDVGTGLLGSLGILAALGLVTRRRTRAAR